jgi:hypothetical protein
MKIKVGRLLSAIPDRDTVVPWSDIESRFTALAQQNAAFQPLADLAAYLARSEFAKAGLCGATSMHDLVIGPSTRVFQNPHLGIEYDFDVGTFSMIYVNGAAKPWERSASPERVVEMVKRFLTKRVRWYTSRGPAGGA